MDITTMTSGDGGWQRCDVHLVEKAHDIAEVAATLTAVGFTDVEVRTPPQMAYPRSPVGYSSPAGIRPPIGSIPSRCL